MHFFPRSLRLKVTANVFATSFVVILLFGSLIFSQIRVVSQTLEKEKLLHQAQKISFFLEYDRNGKLQLDLPRQTRDYYTKGASSQYAVVNTIGRVLFSSDSFNEDNIKDTLGEGGKYYFDFMTEDGLRFEALKYDYLFEGKIYPIYIIEEEAEFSKSIATLEREFLTNILAYGLPLLILQGLLVLFIFRQAFQPIIQAAGEAKKIKYDNLSFRLNDEDVPVEILPLIESINIGLARLEESAEAQKFFIANAAHELRTPISILKTRITSLKDKEAIDLLNEDLQNINRLIGQMLDISRLDLAETAPKTDVNLNDLAKKACESLGALFVTAGKELSLEQLVHNQIIRGNEDTLFRAILNLLENALKHTPDNSQVEVIVDDRKIIVRDYGTPISDKDKDRIFERFEKLPDTRTKGSGLGLAIVKKAAEIHNGTITIISRKDGNDFVLEL